MSEDISFKVIVKKKTYATITVSNILLFLFLIAGVSFLILDIIALPAKGASEEMQVGYYILVMPKTLIKFFLDSSIAIIIFFIIRQLTYLYVRGIMMLKPDMIVFRGRLIKLSIPVRKIRKIYCIDMAHLDGFPKGVFKLDILYVHGSIKLKLLQYEDVEPVLDLLGKYENVKFIFVNRDWGMTNDL